MRKHRQLKLGGRVVVTGMDSALVAERDHTGVGMFLRVRDVPASAFHRLSLGVIAGLARFTSAYRYDPFWMRPVAGCTYAEIREETQFLLVERRDGRCVLVVPLFDDPTRFSLAGSPNAVQLVGETGDAFTTSRGGLAAFVAIGRDPYALVEAGARAVVRRLGTGRLRREKRLPDFVNQFGWCTWDAFYGEVSPAKIREGLASFAAGGVVPRLLIVDDGWLSVERGRMTALAANEKFGGSLAPTVAMAKGEFGIQTLLAWHATLGHWGGVDAEKFCAYRARAVARSYGPGILRHTPDSNVAFGATFGLIPPAHIGRFYKTWHRQMAAWGVDGVKVDGQAMLEGAATGMGGRVRLYRAYRAALEASAHRHFDGRVINCMSNNNETHLMCRETTVLRTSTDFWPSLPASHGEHLYTNSQIGVWFGQFVQPDWDMFQSNHERGAFHAAGRAISGGPVYVSDKPVGHDFALLRKLVLSDGTVPRADRPGVPARDCLFRDPTREAVLLKIVNHNGDGAVIGVFHCQYHADPTQRRTLAGRVAPADAWDRGVPPATEFAVFAHTTGTLRRVRRRGHVRVQLAEGGWQIFTLAPVRRGVAVIGLTDKLNSGGTVVTRRDRAGACTVTLRDGGDFVAWCARRPGRVTVNGQDVAFRYRRQTGRLSLHVNGAGRQRVDIHR